MARVRILGERSRCHPLVRRSDPRWWPNSKAVSAPKATEMPEVPPRGARGVTHPLRDGGQANWFDQAPFANCL